MPVEKVLLIPDCHRPYHHSQSYGLMIKAAKELRPDRIVVFGDYVDFYCTSQHRKDPNRILKLEYEVKSGNEGLDELDSIGAKKKYFLQGNHEENLERYLKDNAPELFNMMKIEEIFKLRQRGWEYIPYGKSLKIGKMYMTHCIGKVAGASAHIKSRDKHGGNLLIGHTHKMSIDYTGDAENKHHVGAMLGWLGDPTKAEYAHEAERWPWQHGFGIGYLEPTGTMHVQLCPIIKGKVIVEGKLIK